MSIPVYIPPELAIIMEYHDSRATSELVPPLALNDRSSTENIVLVGESENVRGPQLVEKVSLHDVVSYSSRES